VPEVEHGLRAIPSFLLSILIASATLPAGELRAEEVPVLSAGEIRAETEEERLRAELRRIADANRGTERGYEARFELIEMEREGESYLRQMEALAGEWPDPRAWFALARYRYLVGAYRAAAEDFQKAADRLSGERRYEARCWRGVSLLGAGEERAAISLLREVAEEASGSPAGTRARFLAAQAEYGAGRPEAALRTVEPLLEGEHDYLLPSLLLSARALEQQGETGRARERYAALLDRSPGSVEAEEALRFLRAEEKKKESPAGFYVQIASFEVEENALRFVAERSEEGVGALRIHTEEKEGRTLYPVRVGPFDTSEEAEEAKRRMDAQGIEGIVHEVSEEE